MIEGKLNPKEAIGFLAWKVSRITVNDLTARFAEANIGVTVEQWRALIPIYAKDSLTQGDLCKVLSQEKTGVSRLVAALERRNLIRREPGKVDRRVKSLFITDAGKKLVDSSIDLVLESRAELIKDIDPDELRICYKVLWQIIEANSEGVCTVEDVP